MLDVPGRSGQFSTTRHVASMTFAGDAAFATCWHSPARSFEVAESTVENSRAAIGYLPDPTRPHSERLDLIASHLRRRKPRRNCSRRRCPRAGVLIRAPDPSAKLLATGLVYVPTLPCCVPVDYSVASATRREGYRRRRWSKADRTIGTYAPSRQRLLTHNRPKIRARAEKLLAGSATRYGRSDATAFRPALTLKGDT